MLEFSAFLLLAAFYLLINMPYRGLLCHQDAGWHSYWGAFRAKGVTLRYQENVLLGCTRLGCAFLFAFWFKIFGVQNPDRLARNVAQGGNIVVVGAFVFVGIESGLVDSGVAWVFAGLFFLLMSFPTLAVHYESAERTANLFDVFIFLGAMFAFLNPQPAWIGVFVFVAVLTALLIKVTQLAPYGVVWGALFFAHPGQTMFIFSVLGCLCAVSIFVAILWRTDLLRKENLGVFGYASHSANTANSGQFEDLEQKIGGKLGGGKFSLLAVRLGRLLGVERILLLYGSALSAKAFLPMVIGSLSGTILMAIVGAYFVEGPIVTISLAWLSGAMVALLAQGRYFPFHCIPLVLPVAILAAAGWWRVEEALFDGAGGFFLVLAVLGAVLTLFGVFKAFRGRAGEEFDYRFWPLEMRPILKKNKIAEQAARYVSERTEADDFVLVLGTLPQFFVLAERRCPINWLSTSAKLMDPILPEWKAIFLENLKTRQPRYVLDIDQDLPTAEIEAAVGASYLCETEFGGQACLYRIND
ncbi:MAG: hypothetical protein HN403_17285 [Rhodospirillales bacterium]|jgi:hypothetical protein|nr:hypothetical protein [Rhodospirillales bacterium]